MKRILLVMISSLFCFSAYSQETLQSVTDRGASVSNNSGVLSLFGYGLAIDRAAGGYFQNSTGPAIFGTTGAFFASIRTGNVDRLVVSNNGNVGIGTASPSTRLHTVGGSSRFNSTNSAGAINIGRGGAGNPYNYEPIRIDTEPTDANNYYFSHKVINTNLRPGEFPTFTYSIYQKQWGGYTGDVLSITYQGNVGIGTNTPKEKLSVDGKIRAKEIKIETANWPDYVFELSYNPESLSNLEKFIKKNKHLPEIPSAKEVEEHGVSLGEMNAKLLKKIEELTLHLIEQSKELTEAKTKIAELVKRVDSLSPECKQ